jgi:hypothetical protein
VDAGVVLSNLGREIHAFIWRFVGFVKLGNSGNVQKKTAGFEVLTAVSAKMAVFWDVAPCALV